MLLLLVGVQANAVLLYLDLGLYWITHQSRLCMWKRMETEKNWTVFKSYQLQVQQHMHGRSCSDSQHHQLQRCNQLLRVANGRSPFRLHGNWPSLDWIGLVDDDWGSTTRNIPVVTAELEYTIVISMYLLESSKQVYVWNNLIPTWIGGSLNLTGYHQVSHRLSWEWWIGCVITYLRKPWTHRHKL